MDISDFSALIQLSATFCAAYVVIDYAKSFMKTLTDNVFGFKKRYGDELDDIINIIDVNSMERLKSKPSFYREGNVLLCEEVMSDIGKLQKEIETFIQSIDSKVETHCRIKGFGFVCAYSFLFAITQLLLIGIFPLSPHFLMKYWLSLTMLSLLLMAFYWFSVIFNLERKSERFEKLTEKLWRIMDYNANGMILFAVAAFIALPLCFIHVSLLQPYLSLIWSWFWVVSVLLPSICFVVCTLTVWIRTNKVKKEFSEFKSMKETTCNQINDRIVKLKNAQETQDEAMRKYAEAQQEEAEKNVKNGEDL